MNRDTVSTRRSLLKGGALLAAPMATVAGSAAVAGEAHKARLARLEDEAAIRDLHQAWMRRINTREDAASLFADPKRAAFDKAARNIMGDPAGEPDAITIAADGQSAAGRFQCIVEVETAIARDCTLAQMAHVQGEGVIRRAERRFLKVEYIKARNVWAIDKVEFSPV